MLGEGCGREEADTYQSHDAQLVSSCARLCCLLLGLGRGGQESACEEVESRLRELTDLKRRRLPKLPLPSLLSVSSARCSVFSFSSSINLK